MTAIAHHVEVPADHAPMRRQTLPRPRLLQCAWQGMSLSILTQSGSRSMAVLRGAAVATATVLLVVGRAHLVRTMKRSSTRRQKPLQSKIHSHFGLPSMEAWKAAVAVIATVLTAVGHVAPALTRSKSCNLMWLQWCQWQTSQ